MSTERNELARAIFIADNGNAPDPGDEWERVAEEIRAYADIIAEHLLAIGYRKPRQISTIEELDALPDLAVIIDSAGDVSQKRSGLWWGHETPGFSSIGIEEYLPATVLHAEGAPE